MSEDAANLARHMVNVHAFSQRHVDMLFLDVLQRSTPKSTLLDHPWFEKFRVIGKDWWGWSEPVGTLYPSGVAEPGDADEISYKLLKRWFRQPTTIITCYRASRECHGIFGGRRKKLGVSAAHDLGLSSVYLSLVIDRMADGWRLDDSRFLSPRTKRPDAFLGETLVDFGGCYTARRIRQLHTIACDWGRPLQIF